MREHQHLEQLAHGAGIGQAEQGGAQRAALIGRRPLEQLRGAQVDAKRRQKGALRYRTVHRGAAAGRGFGQRAKIHVRGQIGGAGRSQRVARRMVARGLQGVAGRPLRPGAVVDHQGNAPVLRDAAGDGPCQLAARGADLRERARDCLGQAGAQG